MDQICLVIPVLAARVDAARDFMRALDAERRAEYDHCARRIGIDKEAWFLASGPQEVSLITYVEAADFAHALGRFASSTEDFDGWFKDRLADVTGIDLDDPPAITLPALLSTYSSAGARARVAQPSDRPARVGRRLQSNRTASKAGSVRTVIS